MEHIVIYPVAGWMVLAHFFLRKRGLPPVIWLILALWSIGTFWMTASAVIYSEQSSGFGMIAALDNFVEPIALVLTIGVLVQLISPSARLSLLRRELTWVVGLVALNALVAISTIYWNTWQFVRWFVRPGGRGASVWEMAASMGRYTGIFDQPLEAGIAYSLAIIAWVYLVLDQRRPGMFVWLAGALIVAGGLLTVSKVFIVGGIPLAAGYALWLVGPARPQRMLLVVLGAMAAFAIMTAQQAWMGWGYLKALFDAENIAQVGVVSLFTAGRFGSADATVVQRFADVLREEPIRGFGLGSYDFVDSAYLEFFYQGGAVALGIYCFVLLVLGVVAVRMVISKKSEGKLFVILWLLILFAGIGAPVLTINRASVLLWAVIITASGVSRMRGYRSSGSEARLSGRWEESVGLVRSLNPLADRYIGKSVS